MSGNGQKRKRDTDDIGARSDDGDSDDSEHEGPPEGCSWWCCRWWSDTRRRREEEAAAARILAGNAKDNSEDEAMDSETDSSTSTDSASDEDEAPQDNGVKRRRRLCPFFILDREEFETANAIVWGLTEPDWTDGNRPVYLDSRADFDAVNDAVQELRARRANEQLTWEEEDAGERVEYESGEDERDEVERVEVERPEVQKPEVKKPEVKKPEVKKPEVRKPNKSRTEAGGSKEAKDRLKQANKDGFDVRDASSSPLDSSDSSAIDNSSIIDESTDKKGSGKRKRLESNSMTITGGKTGATKRLRRSTSRDASATRAEPTEPLAVDGGKTNKKPPIVGSTAPKTPHQPIRRPKFPVTVTSKNTAVKGGIRNPAFGAGSRIGPSTPAPRPRAVSPATLLIGLGTLPPSQHGQRDPPLTPTMEWIEERRRYLVEVTERINRGPAGGTIGIEPPEMFPSPNTPDVEDTAVKEDTHTPEELRGSLIEFEKKKVIADMGIDRASKELKEQQRREEGERQRRERSEQNRASRWGRGNTDGNGLKATKDVVDLTGDQEEEVETETVEDATNALKRPRSNSRDEAPPTPKRQKDDLEKMERGVDAEKTNEREGRSPTKPKPFSMASPVVTRSKSPVKTSAPPPHRPLPPSRLRPPPAPVPVIQTPITPATAPPQDKSESLKTYEGLLDNAGDLMTTGKPLPDVRRIIENSVGSSRSSSPLSNGETPKPRVASGNGRVRGENLGGSGGVSTAPPRFQTPGGLPGKNPAGAATTTKARPPGPVQPAPETGLKSSNPSAKLQPDKPPPILTVEQLRQRFGNDERNWPVGQSKNVLADILSPKPNLHRPFSTLGQSSRSHTPLISPYMPDPRPRPTNNVFDRSYTDGEVPRPKGAELFKEGALQESAFDENATDLGRSETASMPAPAPALGNVPYPVSSHQAETIDNSENSDTSEGVEERRVLINAVIDDEFRRMKPGKTAKEIEQQRIQAERRVYNLIGAAGEDADNEWILQLRNRMDEDLSEEAREVTDQAIMEQEMKESRQLQASAAAYRQSVNKGKNQASQQTGATSGAPQPPSPGGSDDDEDDNPDKDNDFANWNAKSPAGKKPDLGDDAASAAARRPPNRLHHKNMLSREFPDVMDRRNFSRYLHMFARQLRNDGNPIQFLDDMAHYHPNEIAALRQPPQAGEEEDTESEFSLAWRVAMIAEGRAVGPYDPALHWQFYEAELYDSDSDDEGDPNEGLLGEDVDDLEDEFNGNDGGGDNGGDNGEDETEFIDDKDLSPPPPGPKEGEDSESDDEDGPPAPPPGGTRIATNSGQTNQHQNRTSTNSNQTDQHQVAPSTNTSTGQTNKPLATPPIFGRGSVTTGPGGFRPTTNASTNRKPSITKEAAEKLLENQERLRQQQQRDLEEKSKNTKPATERTKPVNGGQMNPPPTGPRKSGPRKSGPKPPTGLKPKTKPRTDEVEEYGGSTGDGNTGHSNSTSQPGSSGSGSGTGGQGNGQYGVYGTRVGRGGPVDQRGRGRGRARGNVWTALGYENSGGRGGSMAVVGRGRGRVEQSPTISSNPYDVERQQRERERERERERRNQGNDRLPPQSRPLTPQGRVSLRDKKDALRALNVNISGDDGDMIEQKWVQQGRPMPDDIQGQTGQNGGTPFTESTTNEPIEQAGPPSTTPLAYTPAAEMKAALRQADVNLQGKSLPDIKTLYEKLLRGRHRSGSTASTDPRIQRQPTTSNTNHGGVHPPDTSRRTSFTDRRDRINQAARQGREYSLQPGRSKVEQGLDNSVTPNGPQPEQYPDREAMLAWLEANRTSCHPNISYGLLCKSYRHERERVDQERGRQESQGGRDHDSYRQTRPPTAQRTNGTPLTSNNNIGSVAPPSLGPNQMREFLDEQGVYYPRDPDPATLWSIVQAVQNGGKFTRRQGPPPRGTNGQNGGRTDRKGSTRPTQPFDTQRRESAELENSLDAILNGGNETPNGRDQRGGHRGRGGRGSSHRGREPRGGGYQGNGGHYSGPSAPRNNSTDRRPDNNNYSPIHRGGHQGGGYQGGGNRGGRNSGGGNRGGRVQGVDSGRNTPIADLEGDISMDSPNSRTPSQAPRVPRKNQYHNNNQNQGDRYWQDNNNNWPETPRGRHDNSGGSGGYSGSGGWKKSAKQFDPQAFQTPAPRQPRNVVWTRDSPYQSRSRANGNNGGGFEVDRNGTGGRRGGRGGNIDGQWQRGQTPGSHQTPIIDNEGDFSMDDIESGSVYGGSGGTSGRGRRGRGGRGNRGGRGGNRGGHNGYAGGDRDGDTDMDSGGPRGQGGWRGRGFGRGDGDGDINMDGGASRSRGGRSGRGRGRGTGNRDGDVDMDGSGSRVRGGRGPRGGRGDRGIRRPRGPRDGGRGSRGGNGNGDVDMGGGNGGSSYMDDGIRSSEQGRGFSVSYDCAYDVSDLLIETETWMDRSISVLSDLPVSPSSIMDHPPISHTPSIALIQTPASSATFVSSICSSSMESSNVLGHQSSSRPSSVALREESIFRDPFASLTRSPFVGLRDSQISRPHEEPLSPKTIPSSPPPDYSTAVGSSPPLPVSFAEDIDDENTDLENYIAATLDTPSPDKSSSRKSTRMRTSPYRGRGTPKRHKRKSHSEEDFVPSSSESGSPSFKRCSRCARNNHASTPRKLLWLKDLLELDQEDQHGVPSSPPISSRTRLRFRNAKRDNEDNLVNTSSPPISSRTRSRFRDAEREGENDLALVCTPDRSMVRRKLDFGMKVERVADDRVGGLNENFDDIFHEPPRPRRPSPVVLISKRIETVIVVSSDESDGIKEEEDEFGQY